MKQIIIALCLTSCTVSQVKYKPTYKNSIKNVETMMKWVIIDNEMGYIPDHVAENYYTILEVTKYALENERNKQNK